MEISKYFIHIGFYYSSYSLTIWKENMGVPIVVQRKRIRLGTMRLRAWSLASLSGLRIWRCHELWCRSQMRLRSGVAKKKTQTPTYKHMFIAVLFTIAEIRKQLKVPISIWMDKEGMVEFPSWRSGNESNQEPWGCGLDPWPRSVG